MNEFPGYGAAHKETMPMFSRTLDENHRRRSAAIEVRKIGFGGIADVARAGDESTHDCAQSNRHALEPD